MKKEERKKREKIFVKAKSGGASNQQAVKMAFPEVADERALSNKAYWMAKKESIQSDIIAEIERQMPAQRAIEILAQKVEGEGVDSVKALSIYFDLIGAKKTETLVKSESKSVNFNIHVEADKIQEAIRKAREGFNGQE